MNNKAVKVTDYNKYILSYGEWVKYTAGAAVVLLTAGMLFFRDILLCMLICLFAPLYPLYMRKELQIRRKRVLTGQFKEALYSVSSSLAAGRSVESAFLSSAGDLRIMYGEGGTMIIREMELVKRRLEMNEPLEDALADFAARSGIEDIGSFADVFSICRMTGGSLSEVIRNTSSIISQKLEIKNEIDVLVAQQRLNQRILNLMPFGLVALITAGSPDYIKPLYSPSGHVVMASVLALLAVSYAIGSRIARIEV